MLPLVLVFQRSLYRGNIFGTNLTFAGLANYSAVFSTGGGHALVVTATFTVGFVAVCMLLGLAIALLLDVRLPGLDRVRAFFIIPMVVPAGGHRLHLVHPVPAVHRPVQPGADRRRAAPGHLVHAEHRADRRDRVRRLAVLRRGASSSTWPR